MMWKRISELAINLSGPIYRAGLSRSIFSANRFSPASLPLLKSSIISQRSPDHIYRLKSSYKSDALDGINM